MELSETTVGWSYQWFMEMPGGDPVNDDQYVPAPGNSTNTLYTTELLQGPKLLLQAEHDLMLQNCGLEELNIHGKYRRTKCGHLNDIPDYLCFEETADISFQTNPSGANNNQIDIDYQYEWYQYHFEEELGDTTNLNNWD